MATKAEIAFLKEKFSFSGLKSAGFFFKEIKSKDHDAQIKRICQFFGYKSIFDYDRLSWHRPVRQEDYLEFISNPIITKQGNLFFPSSN